MILSHRTSFTHHPDHLHSHQHQLQEHEAIVHHDQLRHHQDEEQDEQQQQQQQQHLYLYSSHHNHHDQESVIDTSDEAAQEEQTVPSHTTTTVPSNSCNSCKHQTHLHQQQHRTRVLRDMTPRAINLLDPEIEKRGIKGVPKLKKLPLTVPKSPQFTKRVRATHSGTTNTASLSSHNYHPYKGPSFGLHPTTTPRQSQSQTQYKSYRSGITERGHVNSAESARRLSKEPAMATSRAATLSSGGAGPIRIRTATTQQRVTRPAPPQQQQHHHSGPAPKPKLTIPQPFKLRTQTRGERYQEQFKDKLTKWKKMENEHHQFKALPLPAHKASLFVPKKSTKPLTYSTPVVLQTDRRAEDREHYEQERNQKEKILEDIKAAKAREDEVTLKELEKRLRDIQEMRRLRQKTVVKLTPIRHYNRIEIHKSTRPLTTPYSPNIGEKRRRMEREASQLSRTSHYHDSTTDGESGHDDQYHHNHQPVKRPQQPRLTAQERLANFERSARRAPETAKASKTARPATMTTTTSSSIISPPRKIALPSMTRRISSSTRTTNTAATDASNKRQDRVRDEIERQRTKDLTYNPPVISLEQKLQEIQRQHDEQIAQERQQEAAQAAAAAQALYGHVDSHGSNPGYASDNSTVQGYRSQVYTSAPALTPASRMRTTAVYEEDEPLKRNKRPRMEHLMVQQQQYIETSASEAEIEHYQDPLPTIRRPMGRKSWLEANDL